MAIRELNAPTRSTRKPKYPFTKDEVTAAVKMLKAGKTPGVGPYEGDNAIREARSAAQSLVRHVQSVEPDMPLGTKAWTDENDEAYAIIRVKD